MDTSISGTLTDQEAGALLAVMGSFFLVILIIGFIFYLVDAIARFKYLRIRNYSKAWLAFIPIFGIYATVEATYGKVDKIRVFGVDCPANVIKLYPIAISAITGIASRIQSISTPVSTICGIISIALGVVVLRDTLARLDKNVSVGFCVLANIIGIIGSITLLGACKPFAPGQLDYMTDTRVLPSQEGTDSQVPPQ